MKDSGRHAVRWSTVALLTAAGVGALSVVAAGVVAVVVARMVVTPPKRRTEDVRILAIDRVGDSIRFDASPDAALPGEYGFWFADGRGHARLGEVVSSDQGSVTRRILGVDFGDLDRATRGRFSGWFYLSPRDLNVPFRDVSLATTLGTAPAWFVPAASESSRWVIQVHGRAVRRQETLRAVPVFREAGYNSLLISYRNDGDAPPSLDRRYGLGDTEWLDVDAALKYAADGGATEVILMGWSMGGATVLQAATRSPHAGVVRGIVLDSPVVDWVAALRFQAELLHVPAVLSAGSLALIGSSWGRRLTGQAEAIDLDRLDFLRRASELHLPILLLHSDDDGYIPSTASRALAAARPDIVTLEAFQVARHTKLWNYDPERWNRAITRWLERLG